MAIAQPSAHPAATFRPPATQRVFDVAVLGGGVGGAAAGALLSRRGFRVLQVDTGGVGAAADGGWLFPAAPSLRPIFKALPTVEALLSEVGLVNDAARSLEPLAPDLQLLYPRHRFELAREPTRLAAELRREYGADAPRLAEALAALASRSGAGGELLRSAPPLPPAGFIERWVLGRAVKAAARAGDVPSAALAGGDPLAGLAGHDLATALLALPRFLSSLDGPPSALALARLGGVALHGLGRPTAGVAQLEELLSRRLRETRGDLIGSSTEPARLESIAVEGGRLGTIRIAGISDTSLARVVLLAMPLAAFLPHLPPDAISPRAARKLGRLRPGRRLAALHLVLRPAALPPGLGGAAMIIPAGASPDEAVLLETGPARRDPRRPEAAAGERLVSAWTLAPAEGDAAVATARLEAALAEAFPFHEAHLVHRLRPPPAPHLVEVDQPALGVGGLPVRTPWKNLLLASREVLPGLGLEGEIYAGLQAAARAATLLGARDRLR